MTRISYGKLSVPVHCVGVPPLRGLPEVPESPVRALDAGLLAWEVSMEVLGEAFLPAYTEGDNRAVVATDTMKNVILRHALEHADPVPEAFLASLGRRFLDAYEEMETLRLRARELPFAPVDGSRRLYSLSAGEHGVAELELDREGLLGQRSGLEKLRLLKTTGSAFTRFARDDATTLPERGDRPLFIHMDVAWRYADPADSLAGDPSRYVVARAGARRDLRRLRRVRERVDPAPGARARAPAARPLPGAARGLLRGGEPHARSGARVRAGRRPARVHGGVPGLRAHHADADAVARVRGCCRPMLESAVC